MSRGAQGQRPHVSEAHTKSPKGQVGLTILLTQGLRELPAGGVEQRVPVGHLNRCFLKQKRLQGGRGRGGARAGGERRQERTASAGAGGHRHSCPHAREPRNPVAVFDPLVVQAMVVGLRARHRRSQGDAQQEHQDSKRTHVERFRVRGGMDASVGGRLQEATKGREILPCAQSFHALRVVANATKRTKNAIYGAIERMALGPEKAGGGGEPWGECGGIGRRWRQSVALGCPLLPPC